MKFHDLIGKETSDLHEKYNVDIEKDLYSNAVPSEGTTMILDVDEHMTKELTAMDTSP